MIKFPKFSVRRHTFRSGDTALIVELVGIWYQNCRTHGIAFFRDHVTVAIGIGYKEYPYWWTK